MLGDLNVIDQDAVIKLIPLPEDVVVHVQRLNYEAESYRSVVKDIVRGNDLYKYNMELYEYHMDEYKKAYFAFRLSMDELSAVYCTDYPDKSKISLSVSFVDNMLVVTPIRPKSMKGCSNV